MDKSKFVIYYAILIFRVEHMRQILELVGFIEDCCPLCVLIPKDRIQASSIEQGHVQILCILFHSFLSDRDFAAVAVGTLERLPLFCILQNFCFVHYSNFSI